MNTLIPNNYFIFIYFIATSFLDWYALDRDKSMTIVLKASGFL